jgi:hypothetical protein
VALWLVCAASTAVADETSPPVRASLELVTPDHCGDRALLISGIIRRSERIRIANATEPRHVRVSIARAGDELSVALTFQQPNGRRASRTLRARTCDEAIEAAALVAALSLDPSASTAPEDELPPAFAPPPAPKESTQNPTTRPPPRPTEPRQQPRREAERTADPSSVLWSAGVLVAATWQPAPAPMPGIGISLLVRHERSGVFAPAARLTLAHFGRNGFSASRGVGEAAFELESATLDLCPLRLQAWRLGIAPCGFGNAGVLRVGGSGALDTRAVTRPWWVFGGSALAVLELSEVLQLEGAASVGKPLIQDAFQFEPLVVHTVRPWVVTVGLGAGFRFR